MLMQLGINMYSADAYCHQTSYENDEAFSLVIG